MFPPKEHLCIFSSQVSWKGSDDKDFNQTIVLEEIKKVFRSADMRGNQSVFLFNVGIHYPLTLNFTTYKLLIDSIVEMLREETGTEHEGALSNQALSIWRSNVAVEAERFAKFFPQLNYTEWRFYTNQVIHVCYLENYQYKYINIVIVMLSLPFRYRYRYRYRHRHRHRYRYRYCYCYLFWCPL